MSFKPILLSTLLFSAMLTPAFAQIPDLTMTNHTNLDSTCIINKSGCSSRVLPGYGTTRAHSVNTIPGRKVGMACNSDLENCVADVYATNNCAANGDKPIATVIISVYSGIKDIKILNPAYHITGIGTFNAVLEGGPGSEWEREAITGYSKLIEH